MKLHAQIALIALVLSLSLVRTGAAGEKEHRRFVPGVKITLEAPKVKFFLGENIVIDYQIEYSGEGALVIDYSSSYGPPHCFVTATYADGKKAPASTRRSDFEGFGGSGGSYIRKENPGLFAIPLTYYCRLEKPGKYRIRAAYNLGWSDYKAAIAADDPRWVETTIEVVEPDAAQAAKVVEQMVLSIKEGVPAWDPPRALGIFACLRYPVYLPILEKMAVDARGDTPALLGIAHNPTPEATQALFRLLNTAEKEGRRMVAAALCDRLPKPKGFDRPGRRHPIQKHIAHAGDSYWFQERDADPQLVAASWRDDFVTPMRQFARKALMDDDPKLVQCAAYALEAVGDQGDMPDLAAAASRLVPLVDFVEFAKRVLVQANLDSFIGLWRFDYFVCVPVYQARTELTYAIEAMAARGVEPKADPRTPGEIIHFVATVKQRNDFRPEGWEKRCTDWIKKESPFVRAFVLFNRPRQLPKSLVDTYRNGTRKVIATTRDDVTIHVAVQNALDLKIPMDELLGMLVDRLQADRHPLYAHLVMCLEDLLTTGKHEHAFWACTPPLNRKEIVAVKAQWKSFLKDQGGAIRNGKLFDDFEDFHRLMYPHLDQEK